MEAGMPVTDTSDQAYRVQLKILAEMPPGRKLQLMMEWSDMARVLFRCGLRRLNPEMTDEELNQLYLARLKLCHSKSS